MSSNNNLIKKISWDTNLYMIDLFENQDLTIEEKTDKLVYDIDSLDDEIKRLEDYKNIIIKKIKDTKENKEKTLRECANYLNNAGVDKIKGNAISSITLTKKTDDVELLSKKFINSMTKEETEEFLISKGLARYEETKKIKVGKASTLRINRRKS